MHSLRRTSRILLAGAASTTLVASACSLFPSEEGRSEVNVYSTHSGTPDGEVLPDYGPAEYPREFQNDLGWDIQLLTAYVTISRVALIPCGESQGPLLDMFFGPCAENFIKTEDGHVLGLGAVSLDDGQYCSIRVEHGNFEPDADSSEPHAVPDDPNILGRTFYVRLMVSKDGSEPQEVTLASDAVFAVDVDTSSIEDGGPLALADENFTYKVTIGKVYDRFFDGIDFADYTDAELEAAIIAGLEQDSFAVSGTDIRF